MIFSTEVETEVDVDIQELVDDLLKQSIVLYNDDVNTFDHVIRCLMRFCGHELTQAEQCALIVHNNGKCSVKGGTYEELEPICTALLDRGLSAKIE
jgi:ATP-dependent Clp protease adaptor protein ClpS